MGEGVNGGDSHGRSYESVLPPSSFMALFRLPRWMSTTFSLDRTSTLTSNAKSLQHTWSNGQGASVEHVRGEGVG